MDGMCIMLRRGSRRERTNLGDIDVNGKVVLKLK